MISIYKQKEKIMGPKVLLSCLLKRGNKERATMQLIKLLLIIRRIPQFEKLTQEIEKPHKLLETIISKIVPGFHFRKLSRGGRLYNIPIPSTAKHRFFVACHWILNSAMAHPQKNYPIYLKILSELKAFSGNNGSTFNSFKNYISTALDNRPFSRLLRRKRILIKKKKIFRKYVSFAKTKGLLKNKWKK